MFIIASPSFLPPLFFFVSSSSSSRLTGIITLRELQDDILRSGRMSVSMRDAAISHPFSLLDGVSIIVNKKLFILSRPPSLHSRGI